MAAGRLDPSDFRRGKSPAQTPATVRASAFVVQPDAAAVIYDDTVTDALTAVVAQAGTADFAGARAETATVAESQTGVAAFVGTTAETLTPSAAQLAAADFAGVNAETITPTAAQSSTADFVGALPETITAADAQTGTASFVGAQAESVVASDTQTGVVTIAVTASDALTVTASEAGSGAFVGAAPDSLTMADDATSVADFSVVRAESLTVTESADATVDFVAAQADTLSVVATAMEVSPPPLPAIAALAPGEPGAWFDSTDGATSSAWLDRMGNGNDLVATGTPTIVPNVENGRAVARLDGTAYYAIESSPVGSSPTAFSLLVLFRSPVTPPAGNVVATLASTFNPPDGSEASIVASETVDGEVLGCSLYNPGVGGFSQVQSDALDPDALTGNALTLAEFYCDDLSTGAVRFLRNGVALDQNTFGSPFDPLAFGLLVVGRNEYDAPSYFEGDIAVVATVPVALSEADRQVVYDWITDVYGLELPRLIEGTTYDVEVAESLTVTDAQSATVETAPIGGGGGIILPRTPKRPGFHITITPPSAVRAWVVPQARVVLGGRTAVPDPARLAWVVPSASVALGTTRPALTPARREWVALAAGVLTTPDHDEELLILSLADGFL